jgi:SAM-dependent methyltransferase
MSMFYNTSMNEETQRKLLTINDQFYQTFAAAFAATRQRIQPGIREVLKEIPSHGYWLDLGCGNGTLGKIWAEQQRSGGYVGLDFSDELLAHAIELTQDLQTDQLKIHYAKAGLTEFVWPVENADFNLVPAGQYDGVLCFAALHHIPGSEARMAVLAHVRQLLKPGGLFIHSEWQFQNSPRLLERCLPWSLVDLHGEDLENGDTLLDWRYSLPGQSETIGYRYVHLFDEPELAEMALQSGFQILKSWYSDGKTGNLAIYQVWRRMEDVYQGQ